MRNNIIFLDCTQSYPHKFSACNTKIELVCRGLIEQGDSCCILGGAYGNTFANVDSYEGISTAGISYKLFHKRGSKFYGWIFNVLKVYKTLKNLKKREYKNIVVIENPDFHLFCFYILFCRLLGFKTSAIIQEWGPAVKGVNVVRKISLMIHVKFFGYMVDSILPISHFLVNKIHPFNKPFYLLPVLAEYVDIQNNNIPSKSNYFVYCAAASYYHIIEFLLNIFLNMIDHNENIKLVMVLSGSDKEIVKVKNRIEILQLVDFVQIRTNITNKELNSIYQKALGLLLPLDPKSIQDQARFSQKIAEYLASCTPIITSSCGEIPIYFTDKENIFVTECFEPQNYCKAMLYILNNYESASIVGINGCKLGKMKFNYKIHGENLHNFFLSI